MGYLSVLSNIPHQTDSARLGPYPAILNSALHTGFIWTRLLMSASRALGGWGKKELLVDDSPLSCLVPGGTINSVFPGYQGVGSEFQEELL